MIVAGFEWDAGNLSKCQKHGLSVGEIEAVLRGAPLVSPDIKHSQREERFLAIGRNETGRPVFIVFTFRGQLIRPLSARYMHAEEARRYEDSAKLRQ